MIPVIHFSNLLALGVLSGTNTDEAFPVRRIADSDVSLPWPVVSGTVSGVLQGEAKLTLGDAATREAFVLVKGTSLSGHVFRIISEDVNGSNSAQHAEVSPVSDTPFVVTLSGAATARRVWRVTVSGTVSGLATPVIYEAMLAKVLPFPNRPIAGVDRSVIQQTQRIAIPGGAPFRIRYGEELNRVSFNLVVPEDEVRPFIDFLRENDGGEPFWFADDLGESYWAEMPEPEYTFDDQAGLYNFPCLVQEIPDE